MTNGQDDHLSRDLTVVSYFRNGNHGGITIAALAEYLETLAITNSQIQEISRMQETETSGVAANKKQIRINLNTKVSDSARKLIAFATLNNNLILLAEVNYSESEFKNFIDNEIPEKAQLIHSKAQEYLEELIPFGIAEETQLILQDAINEFREVINAPRISKMAKSQATKELVVLFKTAEDAIEKIDSIVELVRYTEPYFYNGYRLARKIVITSSGKLAVKGLVTDAQSGEPLKGVTITFMHNGESTPAALAANGEPVVTKISAAKGGFNIKSLPAGVYRVSFKKMGYTEQFATVNVNDGELTTVDVALNKN